MQKNFISGTLAYEKKKWDNSHEEPNIQIGDLVLRSTVHFNKLNVDTQLNDPFIVPFPVTGVVVNKTKRGGPHGFYKRRQNVFWVSLSKIYKTPGRAPPSENGIHPQKYTINS